MSLFSRWKIRCLLTFLAFPLLLSLLVTDRLNADQQTPIAVSSAYSGRRMILAGDFEQGLEHLRRAFQLFPLDKRIKRDLADGLAAYGIHLYKNKRYEQADEHLLHAVELLPGEPLYRLWRGICTYHLRRYPIARHELEEARRLRAPAAEVLYYLGLVLYETDERLQALECWEEAQRLAPDRREIAAVLEKAGREMIVEATMSRGSSSRFDLSYAPGISSSFVLKVLEVLEEASSSICSELGHFPQARVPVVIYRTADYRTVTASPEWSGGLYDGTIRIPVGEQAEMTAALKGTLHHEYAHVVVHDLTRGACPPWLNEGIAELFGRRLHNPPAVELVRATAGDALFDFRTLESGFGKLLPSQVRLAYQQSHSLVDYLATTYGWHRIAALLRAMGTGATPDEAIRSSLRDYGLDMDALVREWRERLVLRR